MPIIKASLGIFAFLTSATFFTAFLFYKIKNRNQTRVERKPRLFDSSLILEVHDTMENSADTSLPGAKFKVLNENDADVARINQVIYKENNSELNKKSAFAERRNGTSIPKASAYEVFNIYSCYHIIFIINPYLSFYTN